MWEPLHLSPGGTGGDAPASRPCPRPGQSSSLNVRLIHSRVGLSLSMSFSQLEKCIPSAPGGSATWKALGDIPGAWGGVGWGVSRGTGSSQGDGAEAST